MIKRVRIQKFMSIEDMTLDLDQINIFIGPTDSGKSVLMRALDAVNTNQYPAARYATHGSLKYAIAVVTEKGIVQLIKSKGTQYQTITLKDGKKEHKEFNAVGRDTPQEVKDILSMPYLPISESEVLDVLYQTQHKPFFLITEDRATFSKVIALISNADKLRSLEKLVNSDILISKRKITQLKDVIMDYDRIIALREEQVDILKEFKAFNTTYSDLLSEAEQVEQKVVKLQEVTKLNSNIEIFNKVLSLEKVNEQAISRISQIAGKVSSLREQVTLLETSIPDKLVSPSFLKISPQELQSLYNDINTTVPESVQPFTSNAQELEEIKANLAVISVETPDKLTIPEFISDKLKELMSTVKSLITIDSDLSTLNDLYADVEAKLSKFDGSVCPICGTILSHELLTKKANV